MKNEHSFFGEGSGKKTGKGFWATFSAIGEKIGAGLRIAGLVLLGIPASIVYGAIVCLAEFTFKSAQALLEGAVSVAVGAVGLAALVISLSWLMLGKDFPGTLKESASLLVEGVCKIVSLGVLFPDDLIERPQSLYGEDKSWDGIATVKDLVKQSISLISEEMEIIRGINTESDDKYRIR
ncbi:MAG: hypothetical protein RLZ35_178 [Pseudomonadota bacterium]|jgi:hypothetical protein